MKKVKIEAALSGTVGVVQNATLVVYLTQDQLFEFSSLDEINKNEYLFEYGEVIPGSIDYEWYGKLDNYEIAKKCVNATDRCVGSFPCPYCELDFK